MTKLELEVILIPKNTKQIKYFGIGDDMKSIKRDIYLNRLIARRENGMIKIVTGVRRCGKSYILFNLFQEYLLSTGVRKDQIITLALDEDWNRQYRDPDALAAFLQAAITNNKDMFYILLDEVQFAISEEEIRGNEPIRLYGILNGLLRRQNVDVYVTGSNSKFLSSDVLTEFRGRGDEVRIYPLSFAEFMSAYEGDKYSGFDEYSMYGGLPLVLSGKTDEEKGRYLIDLFENTYKKDVVERNHLRGDDVLESLTDILASSVGSLTNSKRLADTFCSHGIKVTDKTVSAYIGYLKNAFLISQAKRYDVKGKKYIDSPSKYYFTDVGLRNARLNFRQQEQTHILENIIYNELLVRGFNVDVGVVEHRVKDNDGKQLAVKLEVDFVCNKGSQRCYIQSAFAIPDREKMMQEQAAFERIRDSFKKIIVVQQHTKPWYNENGYLVMGAIDFLLDADSLNF